MRRKAFIFLTLCMYSKANNIFDRKMQQGVAIPVQTLPYRATFTADFQHLLDPYCFMGDSPTLIVTCYGKNMTVLGTSDASIQCHKSIVPLVENGTSYECINTCTSESTPPCTSVYVASDDVNDGPFGSIRFVCEGENFDQIDAVFTYMGGESNGTCVASANTQSRNFHIGRLGVSCPADGGTNDVIYDDVYFDCHSKGSFVADTSNDAAVDIYTCAAGENCNGQQCEVVFSDFYLHTNIDQINDCVETISTSPGVAPLVPTVTPIEARSTYTFTTRFQASWALLYDSASSRSFCTMNENPSVVVTCGSGSSISFVSSTDAFMNCTNSSSNEMTCTTGNTNNIVDQFASVFYECIGPTLPTSNVQFPTSTIDCSGNTVPVTIQTSTTLGVMCKISSTEFYYHGDLIVECNELSHNFEIVIDKYGFTGERYMCNEFVTFPIGSTNTSTQIIRRVGISTDEKWLQDPTGCYIVEKNTFVPTTAPITAHPTTLSPVVATELPVVINSQLPTTSTTTQFTDGPTTTSPTSTLPSSLSTVETITPTMEILALNATGPPVISGDPAIIGGTSNNCTTSSIDADDESDSGRNLRGRIRRRRRNRRRDPCKRRCRERRHCRNFILSSTIIIGIVATLVVSQNPEQFCVGIIIMAIDAIVGWLVLR